MKNSEYGFDKKGFDLIKASMEESLVRGPCQRLYGADYTYRYLTAYMTVKALALDSGAPVTRPELRQLCLDVSPVVKRHFRTVARSVVSDTLLPTFKGALLFVTNGCVDERTELLDSWLEALTHLKIYLTNEEQGYKINPNSTILRYFNMNNMGDGPT